MADFQARINLSAKNTAGPAFRQLRNDMRGLTDAFRGLGRTTGMRDIQRQFVGLGRTLGDLHRRHVAPLAASLGKIGGFTMGAGFAASMVGITRTMNNAADAIDKVSKASRAIDMDPNQLRAFAHVADLAGVSMQTVESGMKGAAKAFLEVQRGKGKANNKLEEFAPALRDQMAAAQNTAEAASMALSAMHSAIEAGNEPLAQMISQTVFGSTDWFAIGEMSGQEVQAGIAKALKLLGSLKPEDYLNIEEFNDSLTDMLAAWKGTRDAIAADVLPGLTPMIKEWTKTFVEGRPEFVKDIGDTARAIGSLFEGFTMEGLGKELKASAETLKDIKKDLGDVIDLLRKGSDIARNWLGIGDPATPAPSQSDLPSDPSLDKYREPPLHPSIMNENLPRRARGGPLSAGQLAIVGEEGPELFRPSRAGYVHTARQTAGMLSGAGIGPLIRDLTAKFRPLTDALVDLRKVLTGETDGTGPGGVGIGPGAIAASYGAAASAGRGARPGGSGRSAPGGAGRAAAARGKAFKGLFHPAALTGGGTPLGRSPLAGSWKGGEPEGAAEVKAYLMHKHGFTNAQASGVVGNLIQESNLNPRAVGDGGTSFGLAQWHRERATKAKNWAAGQGRDWHDRATQLDYMVHEMKTAERGAYNALMRADTVEDATAAMIGFERPQGWSAGNPAGGHGWGNRLRNAQRVSQLQTPSSGPTFPGKLLAFEPTADVRENFARNLRPNMSRKSFTPATREQGYRAAEVPAQKVEIGQGRFDIKVSLDQGLSASNVSVKQPENMVANVGVDRTGAFRPPSGTKTGMRGPG